MLWSFLRFLLRHSLRFLKYITKACVQVLFLGIAALACLAAVLGLLSLKTKKHKRPIQPGTILVLNLAEPLAESPRGLKSFHSHTTTLLAATQALKHGAEDDRIAGLLIRGG